MGVGERKGIAMPWYVRKSVKMGPFRVNLSKRGVGMSVGVRGLRVGTGPRGPYVAGGRGGVYFRQNLARRPRVASVRQARPLRHASTPVTRSASQVGTQPVAPYPIVPQPRQQQVPVLPIASPSPYVPAPQPQQPQMPPAAFGPAPVHPSVPPSAFTPPASTSSPVPPPQRSYHSFVSALGTALLAGLSAAQILGWTFMFADTGSQPAASAAATSSSSSSFGVLGNIGMWLFLASVAGVCIVDWRGFISLRARIPWWRLGAGQKFWIVCAYLFVFEVMVPIYLVGAWIDWHRARVQEPLQRRLRTAQMEAQLGFAPPSEGTCRACGKPLPVGAEFCSYCRAPVVEHPKVCQHCATTAPADAHWCPHCGASLD